MPTINIKRDLLFKILGRTYCKLKILKYYIVFSYLNKLLF